jgi:hypothetical protein
VAAVGGRSCSRHPPTPLTRSPVATFRLAADEDDAVLECRLDGLEWRPCGPQHDVEVTADGEHVLEVRATDSTLQRDPAPATWVWRVDTQAPRTSIVAGPASVETSSELRVEFTSDDSAATFECRLDAEDWRNCSSPYRAGALEDGSHSLAIRATDAAGNVETPPAERAWTVSATPPDTEFTRAPVGDVHRSELLGDGNRPLRQGDPHGGDGGGDDQVEDR